MSRRARNVSAVVAKFLASRLEVLQLPESDQPLASGSASQLWHEWHDAHVRRESATQHQQKLEKRMLALAGSFPVVGLAPRDKVGKVFAHSFAEIERRAAELNTEQLSEAISKLRRRKKHWKEADKKLGFSAALAFEDDLAKQELKSAHELWKTGATSLVESIAKLHCIIEMEDPGMKLRQPPWPQLRMILADLIRIEREADI